MAVSKAINLKNHPSVPLITINGEKPPDAFMENLQSIVVYQSAYAPDQFKITVSTQYQPGTRPKEKGEDYEYKEFLKSLEFGNKVTIGFEAPITEVWDKEREDPQLLAGTITSLTVPFDKKAEAPMIIEGKDPSSRLYQGLRVYSYQDMTAGDIVKQCAGRARLATGRIDPGVPIEHFYQANISDGELVELLAKKSGYFIFVDKEGKLNFHPPIPNEAIQLEIDWLSWGKQVNRVFDGNRQVVSTSASCWDILLKKTYTAITTSQFGTIAEHNYEKPDTVAGKIHPDSNLHIAEHVDIPDQVDIMAQARCDGMRGDYFSSSIEVPGNPEICAGRAIKDFGIGDGFHDELDWTVAYIVEAEHTWKRRTGKPENNKDDRDRAERYVTKCRIGGLYGQEDPSKPSPFNRLELGQTFLIGIVTDNEDPENLARVKVKFPTLSEDHTSHWARIVSPHAGSSRGFDWLPEIDDEVLVCFEHGNINRPIIVGRLWNGVDRTPENVGNSVRNGKVNLCTLKTRTGHQFQYIEEDAGGKKRGIHVNTAGGHEVYLNDSQQYIDVKSNGGHNVHIDDRNKTITVSSTGNLKIEAQGNIEINANGTITLKGAKIFLN